MSSKELELRLTVEPSQIPKLRRLPICRHPPYKQREKGRRGPRPVSQRLRSIYFDTPDGALEAAEISLRVCGGGTSHDPNGKDGRSRERRSVGADRGRGAD